MKKITLIAIGVLSFIACEKETCSEGSFEINDAFGNFIKCSTVPKFRKVKNTSKDKIITVLLSKTIVKKTLKEGFFK